MHAPTTAPSTLSISGFVSAKEIVNALVSIKIRMVLIDYIVAEKVCLGDDDKALVSFGPVRFMEDFASNHFSEWAKKICSQRKVHADGDLLTFSDDASFRRYFRFSKNSRIGVCKCTTRKGR